MARKGSTGHDDNLLSSMAARLRRVEQELQQKNKSSDEKDEQLHQYRVKLGEQEKLIAQLKTECLLANRQIQEMEEFLADYGMIWVGDSHDGVLPDMDQGGPSPTGISNDTWTQANSLSHQSPRELDFNKIVANIGDLNVLCGEGVGKVTKGSDGISRVEHDQPIPISLYANGIMLWSGPFRPYTDTSTLQFVKDLEDGYFPSELQLRYPNGFPMKVTDLREKHYVDKRTPLSFPGEGQMISESAQELAMIRGIEVASSAESKAASNPLTHSSSTERFLKKLPSNVIRNGRIIDVRGSIGELVGRGKSNVEIAKTEVIQAIREGESLDSPIATLRIKLNGGGNTLIVKLRYNATIADIRSCIDEHRGRSERPYQVRSTFPNTEYDNLSETLEQASLVPSAVLHVRDISMLNGVAKSNGGHHSNAMKDTDMVELSRSNSSENSLDVNGDLDKDEDQLQLQKQLDDLIEENTRLKKRRLREKIEQLKRENEQLKNQMENDDQLPSSSTNVDDDKMSLVNLSTNMKAQSFIFSSSNGGTLYVKPIDISAMDLERMSYEGIIDSVMDFDSACSYSPSGWSKPIQLGNPLNKNTEKHTQTNGNAPNNATYDNYPATSPSSSKNNKNAANYARLKSGTTSEDIEARRFVQEFKARRVAHKLTQSDIGERLNRCTGARYGQSYISRLESMQLSTAIVLRMKPLLKKLLDETDFARLENGGPEQFFPTTTRKKSRKSKKSQQQSSVPTTPTNLSSPSGHEIDEAIGGFPKSHELTPLRTMSRTSPLDFTNIDKTPSPWGSNYHASINTNTQLSNLSLQQNHSNSYINHQPQTPNNFFLPGLMTNTVHGTSMSSPQSHVTKIDPISQCISKPDPIIHHHHLNTPQTPHSYNSYSYPEIKHEMVDIGSPHGAFPMPSPCQKLPSSTAMYNSPYPEHEVLKTESHHITTLEPSLKPG